MSGSQEERSEGAHIDAGAATDTAVEEGRIVAAAVAALFIDRVRIVSMSQWLLKRTLSCACARRSCDVAS